MTPPPQKVAVALAEQLHNSVCGCDSPTCFAIHYSRAEVALAFACGQLPTREEIAKTVRGHAMTDYGDFVIADALLRDLTARLGG